MPQHQIPFDTGEEERLLGPLSVSATLWLCAGVYISYRMAKAIPPLPLPNLFAYIHYLLPLGACAALAFIRYKDMSLMQFIAAWYRFKKRKKRLIYEKANPIEPEGKKIS